MSRARARRQRARSRKPPAFAIGATVLTAAQWNSEPLRDHLGERECTHGDSVLVVQSWPEDEHAPDNGAAVVVHLTDGPYEAGNAIAHVVGQAVSMLRTGMDRKFGRSGWRPVHDVSFADRRCAA